MTERIFTDDIVSPGYVWLRCEYYSLPDNTQGSIGYHCVYRPLAVHPNGMPMYLGNEAITEAMRTDIRAYYAARARAAQEERTRRAREEQAALLQPTPASGLPARPGITIPCPDCRTYCMGDCHA